MADFLAILKNEVLTCKACGLRAGCRKPVPGEGTYGEKIVIVGINPGADEDLQNRPFVGRSGQMLETVWKEAGFKRSDFYITNMVKCLSPGNRPPDTKEILACRKHLRKEFEIFKPKLIITLGKQVAEAVIPQLKKSNEIIPFANGQIIPVPIGSGFEKTGSFVCSMYHPAYIVRDMSQYEPYKTTWQNIFKVWKELTKPIQPLADKEFITFSNQETAKVVSENIEAIQKRVAQPSLNKTISKEK